MLKSSFSRFLDTHSKGLTLTECGRMAIRARDVQQCVAYSGTPLAHDELFEVAIICLVPHLAGSLGIGVTPTVPNPCSNVLQPDCCYITGKFYRLKEYDDNF